MGRTIAKLASLGSLFSAFIFLTGCHAVMIDTKGVIAADERNLMVIAIALMLIVVIPVIVLSLIFAIRYRASNVKAEYRPEWTHSVSLELVWWTVPIIIVAILSGLAWKWSHKLDPYRVLEMQDKPIKIQVIALNWKWLFIYPDQNVASINFMPIPAGRSIELLVTSDAPMNSIQIPQLTGQIYAMSGMQTKLHFNANEPGRYAGFSANYSGVGFSGMKFVVQAMSAEAFDDWIKKASLANRSLSMTVYNQLAKPSFYHPVVYYSSVEKDLYANVLMKYMMPMKNMPTDPGRMPLEYIP